MPFKNLPTTYINVSFNYDRSKDLIDFEQSLEIIAEVTFADGTTSKQSMKDWYKEWDANRDDPKLEGIMDWLGQELQTDYYLTTGGWRGVVNDALDSWIVGEDHLKWLLFYSGASSSLPEHLHVNLVGESQKGKSALEEKVSELFPQERVQMVQSMSPKAAYYKSAEGGGAYYANKILVFDEFADLSDNTRDMIKALMSLGNRPLINDTVSERRKAIHQVIEGRPVVWANSADLIDDTMAQLKNRFFTASIDESDELDEKVNKRQRKVSKYGRPTKEIELVGLAKQLVAELVAETGFEVLIPLIDTIGQRDMSNRGEFERFRILISSIAYVNRHRRLNFRDDNRKFIIASQSDLEEAVDIWNHFNKTQSTGLCPRHHHLIETMRRIPSSDIETITANYNKGRKKPISSKTVYNYLGQLSDRDVVTMTTEPGEDGGHGVRKYSLVRKDDYNDSQFFPTPIWQDNIGIREMLATELGALESIFPNFPTEQESVMAALLNVEIKVKEDMSTSPTRSSSLAFEDNMNDLRVILTNPAPGNFPTRDSLIEAGYDAD